MWLVPIHAGKRTDVCFGPGVTDWMQRTLRHRGTVELWARRCWGFKSTIQRKNKPSFKQDPCIDWYVSFKMLQSRTTAELVWSSRWPVYLLTWLPACLWKSYWNSESRFPNLENIEYLLQQCVNRQRIWTPQFHARRILGSPSPSPSLSLLHL